MIVDCNGRPLRLGIGYIRRMVSEDEPTYDTTVSAIGWQTPINETLDEVLEQVIE